ncbi:MAG: hypothetical protein WKF83_11815 [Nocardioidaceae bacterium]
MPKADIKLVGNAARVDLDIAAVWPSHCVTEIATASATGSCGRRQDLRRRHPHG